MTTQGALIQSQNGDYSHLEPLPDPPRERDMQQEERIYHFFGALRPHFAGREDVLISGGGYVRVNPGDPVELAPDGLFADSISNPSATIGRNGYVISEVGKPPDLVLEVASRSTGRRDYTIKRNGYAVLGIGEYWRFDHTGGRFHDAPLAGDTLVDGNYVPIEIVRESESLHWGYSEALGLELWWDDGKLLFRDPVSGNFLPTPEELRAEADSARGEAASERTARQSAEARVAELEAELRRLRGE